ncbi:MAG TPA: hypothetical protein VGG29_03910 [Caulobacteraceae bacterium]|jgi:hypothetical protein
MIRRLGFPGAFTLEGHLTGVLLPRCAACDAPHPAASGVGGDACPSCGAPAARPRTFHSGPASWSVTGLGRRAWLAAGRALLALGARLRALASRL